MKLVFHGAARGVTGSCYLLEVGSRRVLVDCGLFQGRPEEERANAQPFPFDPARMDAVILTHAHIDHSGRIPLLYRRGFRGTVFAHSATLDLADIMLRDAAFINEKDAEKESMRRRRRGERPVEPLYTVADAEECMELFAPLSYDQTVEVTDGVRLRFKDAGHILGSCIAEVWVQEGGVKRKLVFSGDLGHSGVPLLRQPAVVESADLVICESTYGDRCHRNWDDTVTELGEIFRAAEQGKGNILIPAFAIGRTQELLHFFGEHWREWGLDRWQIFLDSPLAIKATEIYARHWKLYEKEDGNRVRETRFRLPNLHFSETAEQSRALNNRASGAVIIAGSGMCSGGRIRHHLKHHVWKPGTHLVIVGFQARGTLGRAIVDGAGSIEIWGEPIKVAAKVHTVGGLSAHADQRELAAWLGHFRDKPPVMLVHGERRALDTFSSVLTGQGWDQVKIATRGAAVDLAALPFLRLERHTHGVEDISRGLRGPG